MQYLLLSILLLFWATPAGAYEPRPVTLETPFELQVVENIAPEQWWVGELSGFPHTFEFLLKTDTELSVQLLVPEADNQPKMSFIAIKEVRRGVEEVTRINRDQTEWTPFEDTQSGLLFVGSTVFNQELEAGVYRMEVSNPVNEGRYVLQVGTDPVEQGYVATLQDSMAIRSYLGLSPWGVLATGRVLVPLFIMLSFVFFGWYFARRRVTAADT